MVTTQEIEDSFKIVYSLQFIGESKEEQPLISLKYNSNDKVSVDNFLVAYDFFRRSYLPNDIELKLYKFNVGTFTMIFHIKSIDKKITIKDVKYTDVNLAYFSDIKSGVEIAVVPDSFIDRTQIRESYNRRFNDILHVTLIQ